MTLLSLIQQTTRRRFTVVNRVSDWLLQVWQDLTFAQRCYFAATLGALLNAFLSVDSEATVLTIILAGVVLIGMVRESWPKFMELWHSLPGKALVLLFYACVANFALGSAAGLVNDLTGVSAAKLPYSHNFALILSLPGWFFFTSIFVLVLAQVLMVCYFTLLLLLKPLGLSNWHPPRYRFAILTAMLRVIWTPALLWLLAYSAAQIGVIGGNSPFIGELYRGFMLQDLDGAKVAEQAIQEKLKNNTDPNVAKQLEQVLAAQKQRDLETLQAKQQIDERHRRYEDFQIRLLAEFIYYYEADSRSRCQHSANSRIVELNDYEILDIVADSTEPAQYRYEVKPCISAAFGRAFAEPPATANGASPAN